MNLETIILSKLTQEHAVFGFLFLCQFAGSWGAGARGGTAWGEMPNVGEGAEGSKTHCHVCTYATILHVLHMYPKT